MLALVERSPVHTSVFLHTCPRCLSACGISAPIAVLYYWDNNTITLWFPIVGNKGVGTAIIVVFLPEVTLRRGLSKFVSFAEFYFSFQFAPWILGLVCEYSQ